MECAVSLSTYFAQQTTSSFFLIEAIPNSQQRASRMAGQAHTSMHRNDSSYYGERRLSVASMMDWT